MEDFFTDYGSTTVKLSNIVTNVRDTPSRLECHWCCFYHSLICDSTRLGIVEYFLVKPNQIEVVLDEHPEYEKLNDLIFPSFQKFSFLLILLISLSWLVTIALTQGYMLLVFVCFLQVSVHRWHAWGFAAWKEGEIVVLINFFMFVISVLLALDEVAYD